METPKPFEGRPLDVEQMRQVDAACRRFEADWRSGARRPLDEYLAEAEGPIRPALREELRALLAELRPADETMDHAGELAVHEPPTRRPADPMTLPMTGPTRADVHEEATVPSQEQPTLPPGPPPAPGPGPARIRYFGDYEILGEIARGGMGVVFRARQVSLNRAVALKMILAGQLADETAVRRFYSEAESAANLDHPGIVPIFEVGEHEGQHYFSMGFIEGQSLAHRLADGPLPAREAAELMRRVSEAVEYAHQQGVVHRDIKPGNILLDRRGNPRVTDFGLAKQLTGDSQLTGSGQIMGTPSYMPPEQAGRGRDKIGPAADVYALGATLYALLTGRPPFQAATAMDTVLQVIGEEPVPPRRLNATVPPDLETICLKCLEKEPPRRYASAAAFGDDLGRYLAGEPIRARPVTRLERAAKWSRRRPAIASLAAATLLSTALGGAGIVWQWRKAEANFHLAEARRGIAEEKTREATEQAELLERQLYINRVNLAQRECLDNEVAGADRLLELCPPRLRDWEWSFCKSLCHQERATFGAPLPEGRSGAVAISPDGTRIASSRENGVRIWDAATGRPLRDLEGHSDLVISLAFSPDGRGLASGSRDTTIRLWDLDSGQTRAVLKGHQVGVISLAFTPDGHHLFSGSGDPNARTTAAELKQWDTGTQGVVRSIGVPGSAVWGIAVSSDGRWIATACLGPAVHIWSVATGELIREFPGHAKPAISVAFSPDGRALASGDYEGLIKMWDAKTGHELRTLRGHLLHARGLVFLPDGHHLASASWDGTVRLWERDSGILAQVYRGHLGPVRGIASSPDGQWLASVGGDQTVKLWDAPKRLPQTLDGHRGWATRAAFSPDGQRLATGGWGIVLIWDPRSGRHVSSLNTGQTAVCGLAFSHDGRRIAVSLEDEKSFQVRDVSTGALLFSPSGHGAVVHAVAYSADGTQMATAGEDGTVRTWDASDGSQRLVLKGHAQGAFGVSYSPDSRLLASISWDGTARLWDAATGQSSRVLDGLVQRPSDRYGNATSFSPDGRLIAAASDDGTIAVWEVATGRRRHTLRGHTREVNAVVFLGDGRRLVSSSEDATLKLWDPTSGEEIFTLRGHGGGVLGLGCSPDGSRIASASIDFTVKVWDRGRP